jgi:hypothetical protein
MKNTLLFSWFFSLNLLCGSAVFAQNIVLLDSTNLPITDSCTGRLYDDGGFGNYSNATNETFTIMPTNSGCVVFTLDTLDLWNSAVFSIYAGTTATGVPLANFNFINNSNTPRQYFAEGAITVRFVSNVSGSTASGFVAHWSCAADCAMLSPCAATVYDAGGRDSAYYPNQVVSNTYCPNRPNHRMRMGLSGIDITTGDNLCIYDSNNTGSNLIACLNNSNTGGSPGGTYWAEASNTNVSGCLTMVLTSDGTSEGAGFVGRISCFKPCQTIVPHLLLNTTAPTYPTVAGDSGSLPTK